MGLKSGYKKTELGVFPDNWEVEHIKRIALITTGSKNTQDKNEDGEYPFFVRSATVERIKSFSFDGEAVLTAGDGVGTGKVFHYINGKFDFHQRVYKISDFVSKVNGYFFYLYFSNNFYDRIMAMTAKSSVDSVRMEMIANMIVPIPPLVEQTAIATALSDVDSLITALDKLIAKKRNIKQGAMQELLTGKKRLPGFTGEWDTKCLWEIGKVYGGLSGKSKSDFEKGNCPYIPFMNIMSNPIIDISNMDYVNIQPGEAQNVVMKGDLLFNGSSETPEEVGMCSVILDDIPNLYLNSFCFGFSLFKEIQTNGLYLSYFFRSSEGRKLFYTLAQGATRYNLSKRSFLRMEIPFPSLEEQTAIAQILSDMEAEIEALERKRDKYKAIKQGMMQELLTGRIRLVNSTERA